MELDRDDPLSRKAKKVLLTDRNERLTQRVAARIGHAPTQVHLFAIGALHLPGETGLVTRLQALGFTVTRIRE